MASKLLFSISDGEIFDAYMSAASHFNVEKLLEEGRSRSIFYSKHEDRESLALKLSRQIYGYHELQPIENYFSQVARSDKTASFQIDGNLTQEEIKVITDAYVGTAKHSEQITTYLSGKNVVVKNLYDQTDYSKNRFRQRVQKEAQVKFEVHPNFTIVTYPATTKGWEMAGTLRETVTKSKETGLSVQQVDLSGVADPGMRTDFLIELATDLPEALLQTVTRIRMQSTAAAQSIIPDSIEGLDEAEVEETEEVDIDQTNEVVAGILRAVTLRGDDLFSHKIFQQLKRRNFFITSIVWQSRLKDANAPIVEFSAEFEIPEDCMGFRFSANLWKVRKPSGDYPNSFASIPQAEKDKLLSKLERFALLKSAEVSKRFEEKSSPHAMSKSGDES